MANSFQVLRHTDSLPVRRLLMCYSWHSFEWDRCVTMSLGSNSAVNSSTSMLMSIRPNRQMTAFVVAAAVVVATTRNFVNFENSTSFALQNKWFHD